MSVQSYRATMVHKIKTKKVIMESEQYLTEYDTLVQTRELQMLKAMLPFVHMKNQMPLAILIQSMEFRHTMRMFQENANALSIQSINNETDRRNVMLQTIKKFCTPKERETIDTLLNIMCVMENYESFV